MARRKYRRNTSERTLDSWRERKPTTKHRRTPGSPQTRQGVRDLREGAWARKRQGARWASNPRRNPPLLADLAEYALPGFGGFAATKFVTVMASSQIAKRFPQYAKHAGAIGSIGTFLAAWFLGHRVKFLAKYHTPLVVGSAIATLQNLVQIYAPGKLSWILSDPKQAAVVAAAKTQAAAQQLAAQQQDGDDLPDHLEEVYEDPRAYTFNDAFDAGRYKGAQSQQRMPQQTGPLPSEQQAFDESDEDVAAGIFAGSALEN